MFMNVKYFLIYSFIDQIWRLHVDETESKRERKKERKKINIE